MLGIGKVKVDPKGKTKEQLKKEIMDQLGAQIDNIFEEEKVEENPLAILEIKCKESEDRKGYYVNTEYEGNEDQVMEMLTSACISVFEQLMPEPRVEMVSEFALKLFRGYLCEEEENGEE